MKDDKLSGKAENLKGRIKEAFGSVTGKKNVEAEGAAERVAGAAREKVGEAKESIEERERRAKEKETLAETEEEESDD